MIDYSSKKGIVFSSMAILILTVVAASAITVGYIVYTNKGSKGFNILASSAENLVNESVTLGEGNLTHGGGAGESKESSKEYIYVNYGDMCHYNNTNKIYYCQNIAGFNNQSTSRGCYIFDTNQASYVFLGENTVIDQYDDTYESHYIYVCKCDENARECKWEYIGTIENKEYTYENYGDSCTYNGTIYQCQEIVDSNNLSGNLKVCYITIGNTGQYIPLNEGAIIYKYGSYYVCKCDESTQECKWEEQSSENGRESESRGGEGGGGVHYPPVMS